MHNTYDHLFHRKFVFMAVNVETSIVSATNNCRIYDCLVQVYIITNCNQILAYVIGKKNYVEKFAWFPEVFRFSRAVGGNYKK